MNRVFRWGLSSILALSLMNCKGQEMDKENLEQLAKEEYGYVTPYEEKPDYRLQINKQGCRVVVEAYSEDYRLVENGGESIMIPFNYMITKSGEQRVKVKVYPREGEAYLTKYAFVQTKVYYFASIDSGMDEHQIIAEFRLPEGLEEKKLPYYEGEMVFRADVPFDYSKHLDNAKDLTKISNIRELVEKKYKNIQQISKENDQERYIREFLFSFGKISNTTYQTLEEIKWTYRTGSPFIMPSPKALEKEFLPLDTCELKFYAGGKVVALWYKDKLSSGLDMKFKYKKEDGSLGEGTNADPLFLYMPEGSDELKVW